MPVSAELFDHIILEAGNGWLLSLSPWVRSKFGDF
jgi:hypothetical protein